MGRVLLAALPEDERTRRVRAMTLEARTPKTIVDPDKLLQTLSQVRRQGWAMINEELELGLISLAVPIRDRAGRVVAAINVSSQPQRQSVSSMQKQFLPRLQHVADRISALMPT
jgi:IclR family transcriptional regulator, pca regulon regulatory protein